MLRGGFKGEAGLLTRREMLRFGMLGGAATVLPLQRLVPHAASATHPLSVSFGGVSAGSPAVVPFEAVLPIPPVLQPVSSDATTDYYEVTMRSAQVQILPGLTTTIWGYNGLFPGPTIRARQNRRVVIRQFSQVDFNTAIHLHGAHVAPEHDGHPVDTIPPGGSREYVYPNRQRGATLWYHDHANHITGPNVYRGLAAFYLLEDDDEAALNLPSGEYDVPMVIQDRLFNTDGSLSYPDMIHGFLGDTILVNGAPHPRFPVARRKYRLRFLNGSNNREFNLSLSPSVPIVQIGTDGGLVPAPVTRSSIRLAPAERVEVVVDFAALSVGSQVVVRDTFEQGWRSQIMRFDIDRDVPDPSTVASSLRPLEALGTAGFTRNFDLSFDDQRQIWVINGKGFDPDRDDAKPLLGRTEIWQFTNLSPFMHPLHLHLVQFQVLDRQGQAPPAHEIGPKDTVAVQGFERVRILVRFTGYTGRYVFHCHRLEHEDRDMMGQFRVVARPSGTDGGIV